MDGTRSISFFSAFVLCARNSTGPVFGISYIGINVQMQCLIHIIFFFRFDVNDSQTWWPGQNRNWMSSSKCNMPTSSSSSVDGANVIFGIRWHEPLPFRWGRIELNMANDNCVIKRDKQKQEKIVKPFYYLFSFLFCRIKHYTRLFDGQKFWRSIGATIITLRSHQSLVLCLPIYCVKVDYYDD